MEEAEELANEWTGGYWNYRLIEKENKWTGVDNKEYIDIYYEIHEVYYDGKGKVIAWSENPMSLYFENKHDVSFILKRIKKATKKSILKLVKKDNGDEDLISTNRFLKNIKG